MTDVRFGVRLPVAGPLANWTDIKRTGLEAERLGFDSVWVHDYIIWTKELDRLHISCGSWEALEEAGEDYPPIFFESLSNLAFLAGATSTIRLGVAVLCLPYREPVVTAKQLATIDALSNGRLELGVGQGAPKTQKSIDFEVMGISRATKVKRTREYFEAMRKIWTEESPSFKGEFSKYEGATIYPKPVQQPHPPVWIGGQRDKSLEMVADYADGWLPGFLSPERYATAIPNVLERLEKRGRDPRRLTIGTEIQIYLGETVERAREEVRPTLGLFGDAYTGMIGGMAEDGEAVDPLEEVWNSSLVGTPEWVAEEIGRYVEAGCTFFELKFIYHNMDHLLEQWEQFTSEVSAAFA